MEGSRSDVHYAYSSKQKGFCPGPEEGKGSIRFDKAKEECSKDPFCTAITVDLEVEPIEYKKCQKEVDLNSFINCCVYTKGNFE